MPARLIRHPSHVGLLFKTPDGTPAREVGTGAAHPDLTTFSRRLWKHRPAYRRLDRQLGWRFLYTPASTLAPGTRLAFVGSNPGGNEDEPEKRGSVPKGNAYRDERWRGADQSPLQIQVQLFYKELAERLGDITADDLMDQTLALNFCPFRSPEWKQLAYPKESIRFSKCMWSRVFDIVEPSVIVCNGKDVAAELGPVLRARGTAREAAVPYPTGWKRKGGEVTYTVTRYTTTRGVNVTMVGLPHLSRYTIFGRRQSRDATRGIVDAVARAYRDRRPPT